MPLVLYQSRIWATPKLLDLFQGFEIKRITRLKKRPPQEIIQLRVRKKDGGRRLPYKETPQNRDKDTIVLVKV